MKSINHSQQHSLFQHLSQHAPHFYQDFLQFEQHIDELAKAIELELSNVEIDHLSLRVNHIEEGDFWLNELTKCGRIFCNNLVNGRIIYLIELEQAIWFQHQSVKIIELPFPKGKIYPKSGWEHIEFVLPFEPQESITQWTSRVEQQFKLNLKPNLLYKVSEPKVEGEQLPNPSVAVSFQDKTQNYCTIKIHPYSIQDVVNSERI